MWLFRVRFLLEITRSGSPLYALHGPTVHALLAEANGVSRRGKPVLPMGVIPIAPEQLRVALAPGQRYAMGATLLASSAREATDLTRRLTHGLDTVGQRADGRRSLDGNFTLLETRDLVAAEPLDATRDLTPIDARRIERQVQQLGDRRELTLEFLSPLRWKLPAAMVRDSPQGHHYMDRSRFPAPVFFRRLDNRLATLGLIKSNAPDADAYHDAVTTGNRLVWLDCEYAGGRKKKMKLGGVVGRVTLRLPADYPVERLVWSQYTHVGQSTNFGFGRFRLTDLDADPYDCPRGHRLLDLALSRPNLERAAAETQVDVAALAAAASRAAGHDYLPDPLSIVQVESPHKTRTLEIPSQIDRALQRALLTVLAPGLDRLFESSSMAYRRGLGRVHAARRIRQAYDQGYRWALRADLADFFDSIDHDELYDRLSAYVCDPATVTLLMQWVQASGRPKGIPTGAPISPLLANLFLDQFDEQIAASQAKLVRYADDFIILYRSEKQARHIYDSARQAAQQLQLSLNPEKTQHLDLREPFEYLGFRFERRTIVESNNLKPRLITAAAFTPYRSVGASC